MEQTVPTVVQAEAGVARVDGRQAPPPTITYPWLTMAIGESFAMSATPSTIYNYITSANRILLPKKFTSGKDNHGRMRVWRDA